MSNEAEEMDRKTEDGPRYLRRVVQGIYRARYGVRGALKPPIRPMPNAPRWKRWTYPYRRIMWRAEDAIYRWTGLPEKWHNSFAAHYRRRLP